MCFRLLRFVCSLASAGNVCLAKPNHAFFNCQQAGTFFFRGRRPARRLVRASRQPARRPMIISCTHARTSLHATRKHWRGFQHRARKTPDAETCDVHARQRARCTRGKCMNLGIAMVFRGRICASHKPVCAKTARTFFASADAAALIRDHCGMKKPATFPSRVGGRDARSVSGLRLPAVRRSRPGPAGH